MTMEQIAAEEYKISDKLIIENIAVRSADYIDELLSQTPFSEIVMFIGKGYNGADGLAISRHLANKGWSVRAFIYFKENEVKPETKNQLDIARAYGVKITSGLDLQAVEAYFSQSSFEPVIVDALLGVSTKLPLSDVYYDTIKLINNYSSFTISLDLPTGVHCDTGEVQGTAINADITLAMGMPKLGCYISSGLEYVGEVVPIDMGIPKHFYEEGSRFLLSEENIVPDKQLRNKFSDKKSYGHVLVLGGSHGLTGSVVMASQAALKVGAGLVTAATWEDQYPELLSRLIPEIMTGYIPSDEDEWSHISREFDRYSCIVIGPGLARSELAKKLVEVVLLEFRGPVIVDADALNVMSIKEDATLFHNRPYPTILTPHAGELARFAGKDPEQVKNDPMGCLKEVVSQTNCTVLLKGACTYIAHPDDKIYFNFFPNDGMATAGVGDVLAGVLGGLMAQNQENSLVGLVVNQSVVIHSLAGFFAAEQFGARAMTATSLIEAFPDAFNKLDQTINGLIEDIND